MQFDDYVHVLVESASPLNISNHVFAIDMLRGGVAVGRQPSHSGRMEESNALDLWARERIRGRKPSLDVEAAEYQMAELGAARNEWAVDHLENLLMPVGGRRYRFGGVNHDDRAPRKRPCVHVRHVDDDVIVPEPPNGPEGVIVVADFKRNFGSMNVGIGGVSWRRHAFLSWALSIQRTHREQ
jgi:hypothetical protein